MPAVAGPAESLEARHVHSVYEHIAPHFSATRYKVGLRCSRRAPLLVGGTHASKLTLGCGTCLQPWPVVERFLRERPPGSVGLDLGCGNGKYLPVNPNVFVIGSDRLQETFVADALDLPHPDARFDFAISIAVIHHMSSPQRRVNAIRSIVGVLNRSDGSAGPGRALIFVWALEQKSSRRGWDENCEQDIFVPWFMPKKTKGRPEKEDQKTFQDGGQADSISAAGGKGGVPDKDAEEGTTYQRYYHLYRKGELDADVVAAGGKVFDSGYDRDNWWAICGPAE